MGARIAQALTTAGRLVEPAISHGLEVSSTLSPTRRAGIAVAATPLRVGVD